MKILRLRFKNINSLKGEHLIDFTRTPLAETGIFAITGATGSGKSSILDALSLALYNRTPRIKVISKNNVAATGAIITKHTLESYAEVEYHVNGKDFRSKWAIHRAKKSLAVQDYHMELAQLPENKIFDLRKSEVPAKNAEIIGLNYSQFVKSILLSQGEFARFLKSNANDRGELLEKITGTEIYREIGKAAFLKQKQESNFLNELEIRAEGITLLSEEELENLRKQKKTLQAKLEAFRQENQKDSRLLLVKENLENLLKEKKINKEKLQVNQQALEKFRPEMQRLVSHEKLLEVKSEITEIESLSKSQKTEAKKFSAIKTEIDELEKQAIRCRERLADRSKRLEESQIAYSEIKPRLAKARALDNEIKNLTFRLADEENRHKKSKTQWQTTRSKIAELRELIDKTGQEVESLNQWLVENTALENLNSELGLIQDRTQRFQQIEKEAKKAFLQAQKLVNAQISQKNPSAKMQAQIADWLQAEKQTLEKLNSDLQDVEDISKLKEQLDELRSKYRDAEKMLELAKRFLDKEAQISDIQQKNQQLQEELQNEKKTYQTHNQQNDILEKYIEEFLAKKQRQELEANFEKTRDKLHENEPCPLCGSRHHPYVKNYRNQLSETQKILSEKQAEQRRLAQQIKKLEHAMVEHETSIKQNREFQNSLHSENEQLTADLMQICQKHGWNWETEQRDQGEKLLTEIKDKGKKVRELIELYEQKGRVEAKIQPLEAAKEKAGNWNENKSLINNLFASYEIYFSGKQNLKQKLSVLEKKQVQYKQNTEKLHRQRSELETRKKLLGEKQNLLEEQNADLELIKKQWQELKEAADAKKQQRTEILQDKNPDKEEERFQKQIETYKNQLTEKQNEITKVQTRLESLKQQKATLSAQIEEMKDQLAAKKSVLVPRLKDLNYNSIEEAVQFILPPEKATEIKRQKQNLEQTNYSLRQALEEKERAILLVQKEDNQGISLVELKQKIEQRTRETQQANQALGVIGNKFAQDQRDREKTSELRQKIDKQQQEVSRWKRLNELIGDAEGKKFSKFAQELTLLQLIKLANNHLKFLNGRYLIKTSAHSVRDEEMVVVDTFQANTERSVKTLSGGESFLVSLALALGLSDLAGKNTQIESLFIDEGFGSLDQETLDIALNALEKLQFETNRTIGIISHVESLKERIRTQIALNKSNTGYSSIEILN